MTVYKPVEANNDPALGNRVAQTNEQLCAERPGTNPSSCRMSTYILSFASQSPKKVGDDIAKATSDWKGLRITVKLVIQNRQAAVSP